jgi:hypothetical protein
MLEKRYPADRYPLTLTVNADFSKTWVYYPDGVGAPPKNWTGHAGKAQLRTSARATPVLLTFDVVLGSDGSITLSAPASVTADLSSSRGVWDLRITGPGSSADVLMGGRATIKAAVTK